MQAIAIPGVAPAPVSETRSKVAYRLGCFMSSAPDLEHHPWSCTAAEGRKTDDRHWDARLLLPPPAWTRACRSISPALSLPNMLSSLDCTVPMSGSALCMLSALGTHKGQSGRASAPHDLCVGVAAQLSADQVEGEGRQLLHPDQGHLALLALLLPLRLQLIVHLHADNIEWGF